jgi:predicted glutamine amidotransferase
MCRLFGFRSNVPAAVHRSLVTERNSLLHQSREHKDGWGIAAYHEGELPLVAHGVGPAHSDPDFERVSSQVSARTVVAHIRLASVGSVERRNTHPFLHGRWSFVHNGTLREFNQHRNEVESLIRPDLRALIQGATDSERCFYLFLTRLARRQGLEQSACVETVAQALAETMELVARMTDRPGQERSAMNFLVTDGRVMVASRRHRTLFLSDACPETGRRAHRDSQPLEAGTQLEQLVVASERIAGEDHWHVVQEEDVVGVDCGMVLRRWRVQDLAPKV